MTAAARAHWHAFNRASLRAELERLKAVLDRAANRAVEHAPPERMQNDDMASSWERVCDAFDLDDFERDVLLLATGVEIDADLADRCATAQGNPQWTRPTVGFMLTVLPDAHWRALSQAATLRRLELIRSESAVEFVRTPIGVDEAVLHFLLDGVYEDAELDGIAEPLKATASRVAEHGEAVARALALWEQPDASWPLLHFSTANQGDGLAAAALLCERAGMPAWRIDASALPSTTDRGQAPALRKLVRRWRRQALLFGAAGVLVLPDEEGHDAADAAWRFMEAARLPLLTVGRESRTVPRPGRLTLELGPISARSRRSLWQTALSDSLGVAPDPQAVDQLASTFELDAEAIETAASVAATDLPAQEEGASAGAVPATQWLPGVWDACRQHARGRLDQLAQRITAPSGWDQLVVSDSLGEALRDLVDQVRYRTTVHETWQMGPDGRRGLGVAAMFCGPSGTGKTLAAEVVAHELQLDLYRIDLSAMVSKFIGETEKNLARVFDAAEAGGAVLLFDEADALFGKRSEVKDSHDRYANIEVGYLLQRMESYRGLALLTTNLRENLDDAFSRRLRFILDFPFPDAGLRARLWSVALPAAVPKEGVSVEALARLALAGGQIRSVALNAAFLAAADGGVLRPAHLLTAVRREYAKQGRTVSDSEVRWFGDPGGMEGGSHARQGS